MRSAQQQCFGGWNKRHAREAARDGNVLDSYGGEVQTAREILEHGRVVIRNRQQVREMSEGASGLGSRGSGTGGQGSRPRDCARAERRPSTPTFTRLLGSD